VTLPPVEGMLFSILAGNPTTEELAAVTAVMIALVEEAGSAENEDTTMVQNAWQRSQRPIREPISPAVGAWRGFSGR
jgi:hypothetical protein